MPDRLIQLNGESYLFFSGTAYLCMNHNAAFTSLIAEGMRLYGTNYGSSRTGNFKLPIYEKAETEMATRFQAESALTVSSGYMAAQLAIRHFENEAVFSYAPDCHPALLRNKMDFYSGDWKNWIESLPAFIQKNRTSPVVLVCNSLDPLKVRLFDFSWVESLPSHPQLTLIIDDSHGLGITENNGIGIYGRIAQHQSVNPVVVSSLGKAMGLPGGLILGHASLLEIFRRSSYYTAASPMAPAYLHAYLFAGDIYEKERARLFKSIQLFSSYLPADAGIRMAGNYPVAYCSNNAIAEYLFDRKILISSFAYPGPEDEKITRIIINSHHTEEDIHQLLKELSHFYSLG